MAGWIRLSPTRNDHEKAVRCHCRRCRHPADRLRHLRAGGCLLHRRDPACQATSNSAAGKVGKATCQSILSLVATGDCSIEAAKKNAGITEVTHVDWKANNILGIIGTYTVTVHGR